MNVLSDLSAISGGISTAILFFFILLAILWFVLPFPLLSRLYRIHKELEQARRESAAILTALEAINANLCAYGASVEKRLDAQLTRRSMHGE